MIEKCRQFFYGIIYILGGLTCIVIFILFIYGLIIFLNPKKDKNAIGTFPVEETLRIDSIIRENNNTKIIIEHLNNDKNEEVIKVRNLSNDSTLELFYKLVKE